MSKPKFTWENVKKDKWFLIQLFILLAAWLPFSLFYLLFA